MNVCGVNRLKLTPDVNNEFIFTIKENGKFTPMPISVNGKNITLIEKTYVQNSIRIASNAAVNQAAKVVEIGFPYAFILGQSTVIKSSTAPSTNVSSNSLWQNTSNSKLYKYGGLVPYNVSDWKILTEKITLGAEELVVELSYEIDVQELPMLEKIKDWATTLGYTTSISGNKLSVEKNEDFSYTTSSGLSSRVTQEYVKGSSSSTTLYKMLDTVIEMSLSFIPTTISSTITFIFSYPVVVNNGLLSNTYILTNNNGYPDSIIIKMLGSDQEQETINKLNVVVTTGSTTSDQFLFKFIRLSDNNTVDLIKIPTVYDAPNGKINLIITPEEVDTLLSKLGEEVDRYYMKYVYRLLLEATTKVNGNFIAEIRKVSVG
jgi:hypothetical protein